MGCGLFFEKERGNSGGGFGGGFLRFVCEPRDERGKR